MTTYFVRRFRRIFPPYWAVVGLSIVLVALVDTIIAPQLLSNPPRAQLRPWWFSPSQWVGNVTLTETWRHHIFGDQRAHFVGQSWTLCYEEQFYFIFGLILLVAPQRIFSAVALVTLATIAIQAGAQAFGWPVSGFFCDGAWLMFAAGILVYYHLNYATRSGRVAAIVVLLLGILLCIDGRLPMMQGTLIAFAFALVIAVTRPWDDRISSSRLTRPLAACGTMCYSLYLVHAILVRIVQKAAYAAGLTSSTATLLLTIPICLAVSLVAGWGFYLVVERRFLNSSQSNAAPRSSSTVRLPSECICPSLIDTRN